MSEQMRDFDEWWNSEMQGKALLNEFDKSICQKAWQASRASICVELPPRLDKEDDGPVGCWNNAITCCKRAITKTGVRVK